MQVWFETKIETPNCLRPFGAVWEEEMFDEFTYFSASFFNMNFVSTWILNIFYRKNWEISFSGFYEIFSKKKKIWFYFL